MGGLGNREKKTGKTRTLTPSWHYSIVRMTAAQEVFDDDDLRTIILNLYSTQRKAYHIEAIKASMEKLQKQIDDYYDETTTPQPNRTRRWEDALQELKSKLAKLNTI